jgi:coenzyme Q-binding protein COQ10
MATKTVSSRSVLSLLSPRKPLNRRPFITLPGSDSQSLSASRIMPYKSSKLYDLIADVDSYSSFIPYCVHSKVTSWSGPDTTTGKRWPSRADLTVGWGGIDETYTSRLFCVPGSVVEALSGDAKTDLKRADIAHHFNTGAGGEEGLRTGTATGRDSIFKSLRTRWTVTPVLPQNGVLEKTDVRLTIDFQFANPLYAALSMAAAPKLAGVMIEAFEERARKVLGSAGRGSGGDDGVVQERTREGERNEGKMGM